MAPRARALTQESLGAWLIKGSPKVHHVEELVRSASLTVSHWCLRPTYRTDLIEAGQPVLFWISGDDPSTPAGIYAQGQTTGRAEAAPADDRAVQEAERGRSKLILPVALEPVEPPVLRTEIVDHPVLAQIEVVKMAAGSNPSFVTREHLQELQSQWPQVTVG